MIVVTCSVPLAEVSGGVGRPGLLIANRGWGTMLRRKGGGSVGVGLGVSKGLHSVIGRGLCDDVG